MRVSVFTSVTLLGLGLAACDGKPLTGPEAQQAFSKAAEHVTKVPDDIIVFINDVRIERGASLDHIRSADIERIELLKAGAAVRLYGEEARSGVIRIYTKTTR